MDVLTLRHRRLVRHIGIELRLRRRHSTPVERSRAAVFASAARVNEYSFWSRDSWPLSRARE